MWESGGRRTCARDAKFAAHPVGMKKVGVCASFPNELKNASSTCAGDDRGGPGARSGGGSQRARYSNLGPKTSTPNLLP